MVNIRKLREYSTYGFIQKFKKMEDLSCESKTVPCRKSGWVFKYNKWRCLVCEMLLRQTHLLAQLPVNLIK